MPAACATQSTGSSCAKPTACCSRAAVSRKRSWRASTRPTSARAGSFKAISIVMGVKDDELNTTNARPDRRCRPGSTVYHDYSHPGDRRSSAGQLRPSRPADGHGPRGLCALDALPEAQSMQSSLVRPRPFHSLGWAWLDAALQPTAPDWLRCNPGGSAEVSSVGQQDA